MLMHEWMQRHELLLRQAVVQDYEKGAPVVLLGGCKMRFCQQCGKFHQLDAFEGKRRSCQRRLERRKEVYAASQAAAAAELDDSSCCQVRVGGPHPPLWLPAGRTAAVALAPLVAPHVLQHSTLMRMLQLQLQQQAVGLAASASARCAAAPSNAFQVQSCLSTAQQQARSSCQQGAAVLCAAVAPVTPALPTPPQLTAKQQPSAAELGSARALGACSLDVVDMSAEPACTAAASNGRLSSSSRRSSHTGIVMGRAHQGATSGAGPEASECDSQHVATGSSRKENSIDVGGSGPEHFLHNMWADDKAPPPDLSMGCSWSQQDLRDLLDHAMFQPLADVDLVSVEQQQQPTLPLAHCCQDSSMLPGLWGATAALHPNITEQLGLLAVPSTAGGPDDLAAVSSSLSKPASHMTCLDELLTDLWDEEACSLVKAASTAAAMSAGGSGVSQQRLQPEPVLHSSSDVSAATSSCAAKPPSSVEEALLQPARVDLGRSQAATAAAAAKPSSDVTRAELDALKMQVAEMQALIAGWEAKLRNSS